MKLGPADDIESLADAVRAEQRCRLLSRLSADIAVSLDATAMLTRLAQRCADQFADACAVDVLVEGTLRRIAFASAPGVANGTSAANGLASFDDDDFTATALSTGTTQFVEFPEDAAEELGMRCKVCIPIAASGERFGVLSLALVNHAQRIFTHADIADFEEIARLAASALNNARRFRDLAASEARYRQIIETAQEGVWVLDANARTRYVNKHMLDMLGYTREEMESHPVSTFFDPVDQERVAENFARRRFGNASSHEYHYRRKDGSDLWALVAVTPVFDDHGNFDGALGMHIDITARKHMELRLRRVAAEYQSLAEAAPQIVWTAEPSGAFDYINTQWTNYFGTTREAAHGWGWTSAVHPDDTSDLLAQWRANLTSGADVEGTVRLRRADGIYRWHIVRARALRSDDGHIVRWFGTFTDIHDERRTARQLDIIARTSAILSHTLDREAMLEQLANLIVYELAQAVTIEIYDDSRRLITIGTAHRDPVAATQMRALRGNRRYRPAGESRMSALIDKGATFVDTIAPEMAEIIAAPEFRDIASATCVGSYVCVPLRARGRTLGAIVTYAPPQQPFSADDVVIFTEIAARAAVAVENATLYAREHQVSATLQQALLPTSLPSIPGLFLDAVYTPGTSEAQIGGDWYDACPLPDGRVVVTIGDVTGRGLLAAVIMGRVRQALETLATYQSDPAQLLNAADAVLRRTHPDAIVTALAGVIDLRRHTFSYATAGHPTPIVWSADGSTTVLPGHGLPLGLRDAHQPPTTTIVLPPNARILLYTDGLVESTHDIDEGERRLFAALSAPAVIASATPAAAVRDAVLFDGSRDDVAVFAFGINSDVTIDEPAHPERSLHSEWSMHWTFDARDSRSAHDVRDLYVSYLNAKGAGDADYAGAELVFGELIGNVVRHAAGLVEVEIEWSGDAPVLHVLDRGPGYDLNHNLPASDSETGRGLFLVEQFTQEFTVTRLPGYGAHARAVLAIPRRG